VLSIRPSDLQNSGSTEGVFDIYNHFDNPEDWEISNTPFIFSDSTATSQDSFGTITFKQELQRPAEQGLVGTLRLKLGGEGFIYSAQITTMPFFASTDTPLSDPYCSSFFPFYGWIRYETGESYPDEEPNEDDPDEEPNEDDIEYECFYNAQGENPTNAPKSPINGLPVDVWVNEHFYVSKGLTQCNRVTTTFSSSFFDPDTKTYKDVYAYPVYMLKHPLTYFGFHTFGGDNIVSYDYFGLAYTDMYIDEYAILNDERILVGVPNNTQTTMIRITGSGLDMMNGREPIFETFKYNDKYVSSKIYTPLIRRWFS